MHSPWPKGSPYWYPDSKVKMVMWFNGGDGIHDASWRSRYGPGTNGPHYDPTGEDTGTHGCVNVPYSNMVWLWTGRPPAPRSSFTRGSIPGDATTFAVAPRAERRKAF